MKKKGRGMSYDQKKQVMLRIFHNTKTVYNYQEIQKLSIKAGIPFPSVKQILKGLQDDSLIESEKIGAGVFYWSFPSKAFQIFKQGIEKSQKEIETYKRDNNELQEKIQQAQAGRQQTPQRQQKLEQINQLQQQMKQYRNEVQGLIRFDPQRVQLISKQNKEIKNKINFWTDNLQQFKKHVKRQTPGTKDRDLEEQYGIPADLDYVQ